MRILSKKKLLIGIALVCVALGISIFLFTKNSKQTVEIWPEDTTVLPATTTPQKISQIIGTSVEGRSIEAHTYMPVQTGATTNTHLVFVGGVHGGYEWNSVLLAYEFMDYLEENPTAVPDTVKVTIIPSLNPDGVYTVIGKEGRFSIIDIPMAKGPVGAGRFNVNNVDLNRNFDCKWKPTGMWRGNVVSAGTAAFSEPEAKALRDFVLENDPTAVIFWHSQANAVYASECEAGVLPVTRDIMKAYSNATGYAGVETFDAYEVTGDAEGWLASINIPAITVELQTHETVEWERNLRGINALFTYFTK